jgi:hypothetical protein
MSNERGIFSRVYRATVGYTHFPKKTEREDLVTITQEFTEYIKANKVQNVILIDRSARPFATALLEYWNRTGLKERPDIHFLNPEGFKSSGGLIKITSVEELIMAVISGRGTSTPMNERELARFGRMFEEGMPKLHGTRKKSTVLFDTCVHTGETLEPIIIALKKIGFSKLKVGVASARLASRKARKLIDFSYDSVCKNNSCAPFGNETSVTKKSGTFVCEPVTGDMRYGQVKIENAKTLRSEIREIVGVAAAKTKKD